VGCFHRIENAHCSLLEKEDTGGREPSNNIKLEIEKGVGMEKVGRILLTLN
jgi:hypothetical protein